MPPQQERVETMLKLLLGAKEIIKRKLTKNMAIVFLSFIFLSVCSGEQKDFTVTASPSDMMNMSLEELTDINV
jgi:hypothetical protein